MQHLTITGGHTEAEGDFGGGIKSEEGTALALDHTIVSGNSTAGDFAGGSGIFGDGYVTVTNSTVSGNSTAGEFADGGGIYGSATLVNSIVAGNNGGIARDIFGSINASNGHNIFGSDVESNVPGDLENAAVSLLFAALDPETGGGLLADNGGPTPTIALRDASDNPALAGADPADAPATDQRGVVRPAPDGTNPDIGAFELNQTGGSLNEIVGTRHDDFLRGTAAADLIRGLGGDDRLWGRGGDDQLFGGTGRDVLAGKGGIDEMTGGFGADRFLFRHLTDTPVGGPNYDEILDFRRAQHDKIDVRPIDADRAIDGNQGFTFIGEHEFTQAGQLRLEPTADGDFLVSGNTDRDVGADFAFTVHTGLEQLKGSDFLL